MPGHTLRTSLNSPSKNEPHLRYQKSSSIEQSTYRLEKYIRWVNSLHLKKSIPKYQKNTDSDVYDFFELNDANEYSPERTIITFLEGVSNGLLLCRLIEKLNHPKVTLLGVNTRPMTQRQCSANIEKAIQVLWKKGVVASNMPEAADIYNQEFERVVRLFHELFEVYVMREVRKKFHRVQEWFRKINALYGRKTFKNANFWEDFRDGISFIVVFHCLMEPEERQNKFQIFWQPQDEDEVALNIEYCLSLMENFNIPVLWSVEEYLQFSDLDFLSYQMYLVWKRFKTFTWYPLDENDEIYQDVQIMSSKQHTSIADCQMFVPQETKKIKKILQSAVREKIKPDLYSQVLKPAVKVFNIHESKDVPDTQTVVSSTPLNHHQTLHQSHQKRHQHQVKTKFSATKPAKKKKKDPEVSTYKRILDQEYEKYYPKENRLKPVPKPHPQPKKPSSFQSPPPSGKVENTKSRKTTESQNEHRANISTGPLILDTSVDGSQKNETLSDKQFQIVGKDEPKPKMPPKKLKMTPNNRKRIMTGKDLNNMLGHLDSVKTQEDSARKLRSVSRDESRLYHRPLSQRSSDMEVVTNHDSQFRTMLNNNSDVNTPKSKLLKKRNRSTPDMNQSSFSTPDHQLSPVLHQNDLSRDSDDGIETLLEDYTIPSLRFQEKRNTRKRLNQSKNLTHSGKYKRLRSSIDLEDFLGGIEDLSKEPPQRKAPAPPSKR